jgi:hypothetical protein
VVNSEGRIWPRVCGAGACATPASAGFGTWTLANASSEY